MPDFNVKCHNCGKSFIINRTTYYSRIRLNPEAPKFYCSDCTSIARKNGRKEADNKLTDEEKEKRKQEQSERAKKQWASYDENKRKEISKIFSNAQKVRINAMNEEELIKYKKSQSEKAKQESLNMSKEEKEAFSKLCSMNSKNRWANYDTEKRNDIRKKQSDGLKRYISTLDKDVIDRRMQNLTQKASDKWKLRSDKDKKYRIDILHEGLKNWRENLSDEEKKEFISKISESNKEFWNNADNEWKQSIYDKHSETYWSRPIEWREEFIRKTTSWTGNNKLHQRFEYELNKLGLNINIKTDYTVSNQCITHCWDYSILNRNDEVELLIDLDGKYFHADVCDYNGIQSKEEYDLRRSIPVSNNVKIFILYEQRFEKSFERILDAMYMSSKEYVEMLFKEYRSMPFPYPEYTEIELLRSYRDLCKMNCDDKYHTSLNLNTRNGDRLLMHFHHSIWHDHRGGELSPYEAWKNDDVLRDIITENYIYHSYLNKNKILQGFNLYPKARRVSILSAGKSKMIINKYLNEYDEIFDPFSGYGGIMLASIAMNKRYIGQDISEVHVRESLNMLQFLKDNDIDMNVSLNITDSSQVHGEYQCLFANVPSGGEEYQDVETTYSSDEWIDICLNNCKCQRYVFLVNGTERYKDRIVDTIASRYNFIDDYSIIVI